MRIIHTPSLLCFFAIYNSLFNLSHGRHGGVVVSTVALKRVSGSTPSWCLSVWSLHVPVYVLVLSGYSGFLPTSKNMYVRLIGDSKLSLGVSVSLHGCLSHLSLCGPVMDWQPVQCVPCLSPNANRDSLQ